MILGYYLYYFAEFLFLNCSSGEIYEPGLNCCLQTLIQNKMDDVCPIQQVAYHATSSSLPCHMSMSTLDFRRDSYSDGLVPPFSLLNGSTEGEQVSVPTVDWLHNSVICTILLQGFTFISNNCVSNLLL